MLLHAPAYRPDQSICERIAQERASRRKTARRLTTGGQVESRASPARAVSGTGITPRADEPTAVGAFSVTTGIENGTPTPRTLPAERPAIPGRRVLPNVPVEDFLREGGTVRERHPKRGIESSAARKTARLEVGKAENDERIGRAGRLTGGVPDQEPVVAAAGDPAPVAGVKDIRRDERHREES